MCDDALSKLAVDHYDGQAFVIVKLPTITIGPKKIGNRKVRDSCHGGVQTFVATIIESIIAAE